MELTYFEVDVVETVLDMKTNAVEADDDGNSFINNSIKEGTFRNVFLCTGNSCKIKVVFYLLLFIFFIFYC